MIVTVADALPPVFVAVTVYIVDGEVEVGVPLIVPVAESINKPAGRVGEIVHDTTSPPLEVGVTEVIVTPSASDRELGL